MPKGDDKATPATALVQTCKTMHDQGDHPD